MEIEPLDDAERTEELDDVRKVGLPIMWSDADVCGSLHGSPAQRLFVSRAAKVYNP